MNGQKYLICITLIILFIITIIALYNIFLVPLTYEVI